MKAIYWLKAVIEEVSKDLITPKPVRDGLVKKNTNKNIHK